MRVSEDRRALLAPTRRRGAAGTAAAVLAGVFLSRIISAWGLVPLGWGLWRTLPNAHDATAATGAAPLP
jgi:hypothetical protein